MGFTHRCNNIHLGWQQKARGVDAKAVNKIKLSFTPKMFLSEYYFQLKNFIHKV
jgi:hypothetical protein